MSQCGLGKEQCAFRVRPWLCLISYNAEKHAGFEAGMRRQKPFRAKRLTKEKKQKVMWMLQRWMPRGRAYWLPAARWIASSWQVSSCGRVRSSTGIVNYGSQSLSGYRRVKIERFGYLVHRLVAAAFLDPPSSSCQWLVNHVDGNKGNNHVQNLQYVTASENARHSWRVSESRRSNAEKLGKPILWRACSQDLWSSAASISEVARTLGVSRTCVLRCIRGLVTSCEGDGASYEFKAAGCPGQLVPFQGELWKPAILAGEHAQISGLMVSSHGRILSSSYKHKYVSHGYCTPCGYYSVRKGSRAFLVHRLVAGTFLGPPPATQSLVNHRDSNRGNNHVQNLEYVTHSQNCHHAYLQGRKTRNGKAVQSRLKGTCDDWLRFDTLRAAALYTGTSTSTVSSFCNERKVGHQSGKWDFRFAPEEPLPGEEWRPVVLERARAPITRKD